MTHIDPRPEGEIPNHDALTRPINVSWLLTNNCNYDCGFCWRVLDRRNLRFEEAARITTKLAACGMIKMSWAGGEPLLFPRLWELVQYTKSLGVQTMLITNGSLIDRVWGGSLPAGLDWLTLPLEGPDEEINQEMGRAPGHYERVRELFARYGGGDIKLKVNSVASIKNYRTIGDLIPQLKYWGVRRWKIFQFYPVRGIAVDNSSEFLLSDSLFEEFRRDLASRCAAEFPDLDLVMESRKELDRSYFTLAPDGSMYVSINGADVYLGDLKSEDPLRAFARIELDKEAYRKRSEWITDAGRR